jgi:NAD(P)-dependent dehydrogenase (short-subunit alcohol dehydrogenase family)
VPAGPMIALPWRPAIFVFMTLFIEPLVAPENQMAYDTQQFYDLALAIVAGLGSAALAFRLLPPLSPALRARRLLALTLRDLRHLTRRPKAWTANDWKGRIYSRLTALAIHLDGAFLTTRAALRRMYALGNGGSIIYMGSVHSKEASLLKGPYVTAKHGLIGLAKVVAKEGAKHGVRANVICPGFVRTPLVDKQIPEQAKALGISEAEVIKNIMLKDTVGGEFTTVEDVAEAALFFARFGSNALSGQSMVVSHGWFMLWRLCLFCPS